MPRLQRPHLLPIALALASCQGVDPPLSPDELAHGAGRSPSSFGGVPASVRVWRRSLGGADSCTGQVDTVPMETYVKGVLPWEWAASWKVEALRAGSIAVRSYASFWVLSGGKYRCADLCDTASSQVYKGSGLTATDAAVEATRGQVLLRHGSILMAEYSAENGDPTRTGVSDPVCAGKAQSGHGRGMCQWGTQRWALQGKDHVWMALHYYPGAVLFAAPAAVDGAAGPPLDRGGEPVASLDATVPPREARPAGALAPAELRGGCSAGGAPSAAPGSLLVLVVLATAFCGAARGARARG